MSEREVINMIINRIVEENEISISTIKELAKKNKLI